MKPKHGRKLYPLWRTTVKLNVENNGYKFIFSKGLLLPRYVSIKFLLESCKKYHLTIFNYCAPKGTLSSDPLWTQIWTLDDLEQITIVNYCALKCTLSSDPLGTHLGSQ